MTMAVKGITAEGDRVAVEAVSHAVGKSPAGGSDIEITNFYHLVFFLRDGKITKIHEYCDTAYLASLASNAEANKG
jgi:ketosteroid isomerase-like protein